jgi:glyoxylase-like metal-dependent hydrolase (beta-lactamase superfamily II)
MVQVAPQVYQIMTWGANAFLIAEEELTLVDTGVRSSACFVVQSIRRLGRSPQELTRILVTHHHYDHTGAVVRLRKVTGARAAIHHEDIANGLPYPIPDLATRLLHYPPLSAVRRLLVVDARHFDHTLWGGEVLAPLGGLEVIHTPGHTPGSVCYFSRRHGILLVGDALLHRRHSLVPPARMASVDPALARRSLGRLAGLPIRLVLFGHGGPLQDGAGAAIRELAQGI